MFSVLHKIKTCGDFIQDWKRRETKNCSFGFENAGQCVCHQSESNKKRENRVKKKTKSNQDIIALHIRLQFDKLKLHL